MSKKKQNVETTAETPETKKHRAGDPDEEGTGPGSPVAGGYTALQWGEQPPTEPGLYWIDDPRYDDPRAAKVYEEKRELKAQTVGGGVFTVDDGITFSPDRWAGPIPEPCEPEAESAV